MRIGSRLLVALALLALALGCAKGGLFYTDVFKSGRNAVRLVEERDKAGAVVAQGYEHPQDLGEARVRRILADVQYQEYAFFAWRKPKRLFIDAEVERLAPHLAAALAKAGPDQWIEFSSSARKRDYLLPTPRVTDGWVFVRDGKLNLVLRNLNFELVDYDERQLGDPRKVYTVGSYRLLAEGAPFGKPEEKGKGSFFEYEHNNWLLIDLVHYREETPAPPAVVSEEEEEEGEAAAPPEAGAVVTETPAPSAAPAEQPAGARSVQERLEELKRLLDAGLITPEDYEKKKQELLEEL